MVAIALPVPAEPTPTLASVPEPSAETPSASTPLAAGDVSTEGSGAPAAPVDPAVAAEKERHTRAVAAGERARREQAARRERQTREQATQGEISKLREERDARARFAEDQAVATDPRRSVAEKAAAFRRLGIDPRGLAQAALHEDTPEAQMNAAFEKRLSPVLSELEQLRAWKAASDQREQAASRAHGHEALTKAVGDAARYPTLAKNPPSVIIAAAAQVWQQIPPAQRAGLQDEDVFEYLEEQYAAHSKRAASTTPGSDTPSASTPNDNAGSTTPRTITNDLANPRLPVSSNFDDLDLEDQKARMVKDLKEAYRNKK